MKRSSGKSVPAPPRAKRTFSAEFKAEAVSLMRRRRAEGVSLSQIGRELGIGPALLWDWARKLDGGGGGASTGSVAWRDGGRGEPAIAPGECDPAPGA